MTERRIAPSPYWPPFAGSASRARLDVLGSQSDVFHRSERKLQEAGAGRAQLLGVSGGEEAVVAFADAGVAEASASEDVLDLARDRDARADDLDPAAEEALEHRADQRVVGAAEDDRVDLGLAERAGVVADGL